MGDSSSAEVSACRFCGSSKFETDQEIELCTRCGREKWESPSDEEKCPECGDKLPPFDVKGEISCGTCGIVIEQLVLDTDPLRTSEEGKMFDKGGSGALGSRLGASKLRWVDKRYGDTKEKQRERMAHIKVSQLVVPLGLPEGIIVRAINIFLKARAVYRTTHRHLYAAAVLAATKEQGIYVDMKRLVPLIEKEDVVFLKAKSRIYRLYKRMKKDQNIVVRPQSPEFYVPLHVEAIARMLGRPQELSEIRSLSYSYLRQSKRMDGVPSRIAAASVYLAALYMNMQTLSAKEYAEGVGATTATLQKYVYQLVEDVDEDWATCRLAQEEDLTRVVHDGPQEQRELVWNQLKDPSEVLFVCARGEVHETKGKAIQCNLESLRTSMRIDFSIPEDEESDDLLSMEEELELLQEEKD